MAAQKNHAKSALSTIEISHVAIRQDAEGRYCLNDLHIASGKNNKHRPSLWLNNQQTQDLIAEIELEAGIPAIKTIKGHRVTGTYVARELVYAYAMWISASFHLKVIRAYDAMQSPQPGALSYQQLQSLCDQMTAQAGEFFRELEALKEKQSRRSLPRHTKVEQRVSFALDDLIYVIEKHGYKVITE